MTAPKKYRAYGIVTGSKYLGEYEADSPEEAEEMALNKSNVFLCHQCADECEDPEIHEVTVELVENGES